MKDLNNDVVREFLKREEKRGQMPLWEKDLPQDFDVRFRVDEAVSPAMFKPDPLIPGGYIANSLTLRAMRPQLFVAGEDLNELQDLHACACGKDWDAQFWKLCPYCGRD